MRKGQVLVWAVLTFLLAWGLAGMVMRLFNNEKTTGTLGRAYGLLLIPVVAQIIWFAAGASYSAWSKRREPITGILLGFALELGALAILIIISASAHY